MTRRQLLRVLGGSVVTVGTWAAPSVIFGTGCQKQDGATDPVWGKEPCAHCAMLVSDKRSAAQAIVKGEHCYFDDIGCMVLYLASSGSGEARAWVRTPDGSAWVDARSVSYGDGEHTPMDYGFLPRANGMTWGEMQGRVVAKDHDKKGGA